MASVPQVGSRAAADWRRRSAFTQDLLLIVVSGFFAFTHLNRALEGHLTSVFFAIEQCFLVVMFLTRRRSDRTSTRPFDWLVATIGGWGPLALQPVDDVTFGLAFGGSALQLAGLMMALVGFAYLGKSFGVVAADRGIKVNGPYRFVRHPIYCAHFVTTWGFLAANPSAINAAIFATIWACQLLRIRAEERVLTESGTYGAYRARVRWRLFPGLY